MKNFKKPVALILVFLMMISGVLAGCTKKDVKSEQKDIGSTEQKKDEVTDKKVETPKEKIKVNYYCYSLTSKNEESLAELKSKFEAEHPNIEIVEKPALQGTNQERADKLTVMLMGGEDIDLFDANQAEYFKFAKMGLYQPLDDLAKKDGFDFDTLGKDTIHMSRIDNQMYGIPFITSYWMVFYNKNIFDAAGVPYPKDDWTWDEFRETAKKLTKGEGSDKVWGFTMPTWPVTWAGIAMQQGAEYVKKDGTPGVDNPAFKDALQFKYDLTMVDKSGPTMAENKLTKAHYAKEFSAGNVGMIVSGNWVFGLIDSNLNGNYTFEYDVVKMPHPEGVEPGTTWGAARYIGMNGNLKGEKREAAWELLKFFAGEEVGKLLMRKGDFPAITTPETQQEFYKSLPSFVKNAGIMFEDHKHVAEKPFHEAASEIDGVMAEESDMALTDGKSVDQAIADMQKRLKVEIEKATKN